MICPKCNGRGTVGYFHIDHFVDIECDRCHGSGEVSEVEMTNEEWFCGLSTEEKARFLACEFTVACDDYAYSNNKETWHEKYWAAWLKQPHTTKE